MMSDDTKRRLPLKYWKTKEALHTIDHNIALVNDPFVQLMGKDRIERLN
jgi:hypothetical protein